MTFSTTPDLGDAQAFMGKLRAKCIPFATVLIAHAVVFYLIYCGLLTRIVDVVLPQAVMVSFVAPPPKPAEPVAPTTVKLAALPPPITIPVVPVIQMAPVQNTVTVTQAAPALAERVAAPVAAVSAPPAPAAATPKTITSAVDYIQPPQPVYPAMSKRMGEQGKVVLRILVNEKGMPDQVQIQISSGSARLDEAGRQAALRTLFKPYVEDGRAVAVYVIVPLTFQLAS